MPSQTLTLAQTQQLQMVLAPQLRQSLEMLQLPMLELRAMIQQEVEQNPTIEEIPTDSATVEIEPSNGDSADSKELDFDKEFEVLARLDDEWRDYFFQDAHSRPYTQQDAEKRQYLLDSLPQHESLQEHLMKQLNFAGLSEEDRQIGELIIGSINDDGYLTTTIEELANSAQVELEHIDNILAIIHDFHPTGVGARDLKECLLLQLERMDVQNAIATEIITNHLDQLGARKYPDIAREMKISVEEVQNAADIIGRLNPKPGSTYSLDIATYILPEIIVQKVDGEYVVLLNDDQLPRIRISSHYKTLMGDKATTSDVKSYIRERIRSGAFLIKSIHQRQKTIFRIATEIVNAQKDFLDNGVSHLKPLTMSEVAKVVGVHETTVSRAVAAKYMKTPGGIFDMKYFFTPGIKTADGTQVSNKAVKDMIANMVAQENPTNPLSDQEIMEQLKEDGINIARRTVAKYRIVLHIPPSHLRKKY